MSKKSKKSKKSEKIEAIKLVVDLLYFLRLAETDLESIGPGTQLEIHYRGGEELELFVRGQGQYRSTTVSFKRMEKEEARLIMDWMFMANTVKHNTATHDAEGNEKDPPYFW